MNDVSAQNMDLSGELNVLGNSVMSDVTIDEGQLKVLKGHSQLVDVSCQHLDVIGTIKGYGTIPIGGIIMWNGSVAPDGWALCDGTNETPDLRGRFIIGYSPNDINFNDVEKNGGSLEITTSNLPAHSHGGKIEGGSHGHNASSEEGGVHTHTLKIKTYGTGQEGPNRKMYSSEIGTEDDYSGNNIKMEDSTGHTHTITVDDSSSHDHDFTGESTGGGVDYLQPYYVLAYIIRIN